MKIKIRTKTKKLLLKNIIVNQKVKQINEVFI